MSNVGATNAYNKDNAVSLTKPSLNLRMSHQESNKCKTAGMTAIYRKMAHLQKYHFQERTRHYVNNNNLGKVSALRSAALRHYHVRTTAKPDHARECRWTRWTCSPWCVTTTNISEIPNLTEMPEFPSFCWQYQRRGQRDAPEPLLEGETVPANATEAGKLRSDLNCLR